MGKGLGRCRHGRGDSGYGECASVHGLIRSPFADDSDCQAVAAPVAEIDRVCPKRRASAA
jgi:hypothetical protein